MTKLEKAIRKIIHACLNFKMTESLLILIDEKNRELGRLLLKTALRVSPNSFLMELKYTNKDNAELPAFVMACMQQSNTIIIATSNSYYHSASITTACHFGARILCLSKLSFEVIERCINTDFDFISEKSKRLADLFSIGQTIQLTTAAGTDLSISIHHSKGIAQTGVVHESGQFAFLVSGEANASIVKEKTDGVLIVDGAATALGILEQPIELHIKNGYIKKIFGAKEAETLRKIFKFWGTEIRQLMELGIGTNPKAQLTGNPAEDQTMLGTAHFTLGEASVENYYSLKPRFFEIIIKEPTLLLDGHLIVKNGKILV
jgi:leucyl aminopeptidase (aminopeptidase T)